MKIITTNKEILERIKGNEITYIFNKKDNIDFLIELSKTCIVKKEVDNNEFYDVAIECSKAEAYKYCDSNDNNLLYIDKKDNYKFSIVIPNCNYGQWLSKCLNSVLSQTYDNYEIIFIDDMSTDDSIKIAKSLLRPQDKIIELKSKRLNGGARNEGLTYIRDNSDCDYVVFLDSDDWLIDNNVLFDFNKRLYGQDVMFTGVQRFKNGKNEKLWMGKYDNKYEAMASGYSGSCFAVLKKELAVRPECLFNEGTLQEDRNHHCRICYYMKSFTHFGKASHVWNRDNTDSVCAVRDKAKWGTSVFRNYADCKQFLIEIEEDKDEKAEKILKDRLKMISIDMQYGRDLQH